MAAFARLLIIGFVVLTIVYISLSLYSRAVRRSKLEAEWEENRGPGTREDFVDRGLAAYEGSLRRKLILGVYIIPVIVVATIIYLTNFQ
ncbi:hypothetical protein R5H30_13405 [Sulfitobacter sp. D35]|uniref:hypothetical protein n=1 Tax=Sulfitobacter sp. D35 TaxID=3083252 RepID=UPI00296F2F50|nr:hypothetical protein [Sulfitobacter sp. D35]MDW4498986.1 hypothetical protein [Sulfitobacter sp. D35]